MLESDLGTGGLQLGLAWAKAQSCPRRKKLIFLEEEKLEEHSGCLPRVDPPYDCNITLMEAESIVFEVVEAHPDGFAFLIKQS